MLRKLMLLGAMLAMLAFAAVPALAQQTVDASASGGQAKDVTQQSGGNTAAANVSNSQCVQILQQQNSGNVAGSGGNAAAQAEQANGSTNVRQSENANQNSGIQLNAQQIQFCNQVVQAVAKGETPPPPPPGMAPPPAAPPAAAPPATVPPAAAAEMTGKPAPSPAPGMLPATGGISLIALGAGALLIGGGLVARRIIK
jgi:hypothetical protein